MEQKKTYEEGLQEGYNIASLRVVEALGLQLKPIEQEEGEKEFYNKPKKKL